MSYATTYSTPINKNGHLLNHWPKSQQASLETIASVAGYHPQPTVRPYCRETLHTFGTEHGEVRLVLNWKLHPYWVLSIVLEGAVHTTKREKSLPVLSRYETSEKEQEVGWVGMEAGGDGRSWRTGKNVIKI